MTWHDMTWRILAFHLNSRALLPSFSAWQSFVVQSSPIKFCRTLSFSSSKYFLSVSYIYILFLFSSLHDFFLLGLPCPSIFCRQSYSIFLWSWGEPIWNNPFLFLCCLQKYFHYAQLDPFLWIDATYLISLLTLTFFPKVFNEKDDDFENRGNKEFGSIGRSTSKAHLSMSQYLDRCALYCNVLHCSVQCCSWLHSLSSAILYSSFSFSFPFYFCAPSSFRSPLSFISVTSASMSRKQTSRMKVFSFRTLF